MKESLVGARSGFMVQFFCGIGGFSGFSGLCPDSDLATRGAIQNTNVMLPDAGITVLATIRAFRFLNILCSYGGRNFVGSSDFGIHRFASTFRCDDQGVIHKTHLMRLNAGITILGLTLDFNFEHLWPRYWWHFLLYFRISKLFSFLCNYQLYRLSSGTMVDGLPRASRCYPSAPKHQMGVVNDPPDPHTEIRTRT